MNGIQEEPQEPSLIEHLLGTKYFAYIMLTPPSSPLHEVGGVVIPILQARKLRPRG